MTFLRRQKFCQYLERPRRNKQIFSMALATSRPCATACLQVWPTTESHHARCLLLFDDRTFVGDDRSSEKCQKATLATKQVVACPQSSPNIPLALVPIMVRPALVAPTEQSVVVGIVEDIEIQLEFSSHNQNKKQQPT